MREGKGKQILGKLFTDLVYSTRSHYQTEERSTQSHAYPGYVENKGKHEKMTEKVTHIHRQFQSGQTHITIELIRFLQQWLTEHMLKTDQKFGRFPTGVDFCRKVRAA